MSSKENLERDCRKFTAIDEQFQLGCANNNKTAFIVFPF